MEKNAKRGRGRPSKYGEAMTAQQRRKERRERLEQEGRVEVKLVITRKQRDLINRRARQSKAHSGLVLAAIAGEAIEAFERKFEWQLAESRRRLAEQHGIEEVDVDDSLVDEYIVSIIEKGRNKKSES